MWLQRLQRLCTSSHERGSDIIAQYITRPSALVISSTHTLSESNPLKGLMETLPHKVTVLPKLNPNPNPNPISKSITKPNIILDVWCNIWKRP